MMRMTDETPLVNHSFALPAYVFSGRQNRKRRFEAMNYNCSADYQAISRQE